MRCPQVRKSLLVGLAVLLVVDVLWVGSAGLTKYLFTEASYEKPLFTTYFKTSLFSIYLVAFTFWRPWQRLCGCGCKRRRGQEEAGSDESCDWDKTETKSRSNRVNSAVRSGGGSENVGQIDGGSEGHVTGSVDPEGGSKGRRSEDGGSVDAKGGSECGEGGIKGRSAGGSECGVGGSEERRTDVEMGESGEGDGEEHAGKVKFAISGGAEETEHVQDVEWSCHEVEPPTTQERKVRTKRHRLFRPQSGSLEECPLPRPPEMEVCLLGPPEFRPLCCNVSDLNELQRRGEEPLSPCSNRCCKVRFRTVIEVREPIGRESSSQSLRRFNRYRDSERYARRAPGELLPVGRVAILSLVFGILWFFANYLYALALDRTSVAVVNTLSATSGVFVMILAGIPLLTTSDGDKFTIPRCTVTLFSVSGAILVALSPSGKDSDDQDHSHKLNDGIAGALLTLGGAALYALYLVLLRKMVKDPDALEIPMFFGFVGLFDFVILTPFVLLWHFTKLEVFLLPSAEVWTLLLVNGFVGTVLSELLWLWGVFLTSPLMGTLALSLVTPLSIAYSIVVGKASFSWMFLLGAIIIVLGFVGVAILEQLGAWDPVWARIKQTLRAARTTSAATFPPESQQLLSDSQALVN